MITIETFRNLALSFPEAIEQPHFKLISFRVRKKIFATLSPIDQRAMLKLSLIDQSVFCAYDTTIIYPVPGGWGKKGATYVTLKKIKKQMLIDILTTAYCGVAPISLSEKLKLYK